MGTIYARAIIAGKRTLASVPDLWFDKTFDALTKLATEDQLARILSDAVADGVIIPDGYIDAGDDAA